MSEIDVDDLELLPDDIFDNFDSNTKCGEIFVSKGELNYLCTFCSNIFLNLQIFSEHLFQAHQLFNFEPINNNNNCNVLSIQKNCSNTKNKCNQVIKTQPKDFIIVNSTADTNSSTRSDSSINRNDCKETQKSIPISFDNMILNFDNQVFLQDNYEFSSELNSIEDNPDKELLLIETKIYNNSSDIKVQYENNYDKILQSKQNKTSIKSNSNNTKEQMVITACKTTCNKPFRCEICNKKFATIKNMKNHQKICSERAYTIPYGCKYCPRKFHDRNKCQRHLQIKHGNELNPGIPKGYWKCQICYKLLRNTCSRKKHEDGHFLLTDKNGKKAQCSCEVCGKILSSSASLKVHMRIHNEENRFKCAFCPARFKFSTSLKTHELSHTGERQFQCRYCDKRFLQNSHRKNHEILHNKEKKLECVHCHMKFHRMDYLNSHIKNKHSANKQQSLENNRPYQCKFCQSSFTAEKYLKNHERLHKNGVQYKCKYCDKSSIVKGIIERHEKTHLKTKETFSCHLCSKQFESKNGLLSHVKIKHPDNNVLEYKCGKCQTQFYNSSDLQEHIRKICSIAVKSFGCDMCSARFELEHGLKVHKAVTHIIIDPSYHQKG